MPKDPEYLSIANALRAEVLGGAYDDDSLPGNAAIAQRFDVNLKTAGRAIQHLVAEGLLMARSGLRPIVVPPDRRTTAWPMTGRYARARTVTGLLFAGDIQGEVRKETVSREWTEADVHIAQLLHTSVGSRVFRRASRTYLNDAVVENTTMFFPAAILIDQPRLETDSRIRVVTLLEEAGHVVTRTTNEIRARLVRNDEQTIFAVGPTAVVFEQAHGTYGAEDEPLEAVINVRPAAANVITFDTFEGPENTLEAQ